MEMKGIVKKWNLEPGFGWIRVSNGRDYFLHIKNWVEPDAPVVGSAVEFELGPGGVQWKERASGQCAIRTCGCGCAQGWCVNV